MNGKNQISVVINTYNAELHLQRVLDSVKDFDEVLICDMESTDHTLEIAQKNGCRVVTFPKEGHTIVEPAREFAIHEASYPWVLVIDADELVTPALKDYLYNVIRQTKSSIYLEHRVEELRRKGLFPLPDRDYTRKYTWFRRLSNSRKGRALLLRIIPLFPQER